MEVEINVWSWSYTGNTAISRDGFLNLPCFSTCSWRITRGFWPRSSQLKGLLQSLEMGGYKMSFKALQNRNFVWNIPKWEPWSFFFCGTEGGNESFDPGDVLFSLLFHPPPFSFPQNWVSYAHQWHENKRTAFMLPLQPLLWLFKATLLLSEQCWRSRNVWAFINTDPAKCLFCVR